MENAKPKKQKPFFKKFPKCEWFKEVIRLGYGCAEIDIHVYPYEKYDEDGDPVSKEFRRVRLNVFLADCMCIEVEEWMTLDELNTLAKNTGNETPWDGDTWCP